MNKHPDELDQTFSMYTIFSSHFSLLISFSIWGLSGQLRLTKP